MGTVLKRGLELVGKEGWDWSERRARTSRKGGLGVVGILSKMTQKCSAAVDRKLTSKYHSPSIPKAYRFKKNVKVSFVDSVLFF